MRLADVALQWLQKALDVRTELFGETHPLTCASRDRLGACFTAQGRLSKYKVDTDPRSHWRSDHVEPVQGHPEAPSRRR
jgi:hypothetical protein